MTRNNRAESSAWCGGLPAFKTRSSLGPERRITCLAGTTADRHQGQLRLCKASSRVPKIQSVSAACCHASYFQYLGSGNPAHQFHERVDPKSLIIEKSENKCVFGRDKSLLIVVSEYAGTEVIRVGLKE